MSSLADPRADVPPADSRRPWLAAVMQLLRRIGELQAWLILSVFYLVVILPIGLVFKRCADPLRSRRSGSTWQPLNAQHDTLPTGREQA